MIHMLIYCSVPSELEVLLNIVRDRAAILTNDRWEINACTSLFKTMECAELGETLDVICFDITSARSVPVVERLREKYKGAYIILISDSNICPVTYMKPTIMAASLLLRPLGRKQIVEAVDLLIRFLDWEGLNSTDVMILEEEEGRVRIPYGDIYYLEARNKKIYVCTDTREYGFYDTLEGLIQHLPDGFIRCHRGFIVNGNKIRKVALSEGLIYLESGYQIPLSRSYRQSIKEFWK